MSLPPVFGISPDNAEGFALWASFFPSDGKTKGSPRVSRGRLTAPAGPPPAPRNLRGPNFRGLMVTVRRGRGDDRPRNRAAAAVGPKTRWTGMLDQTGAPDRSEPNFCEDERRAGQETRPYGGNFGPAQYDARRRHENAVGADPRSARPPFMGTVPSGPPPAAFWFLFRRGKRNSPQRAKTSSWNETLLKKRRAGQCPAPTSYKESPPHETAEGTGPSAV